MIVDAPARSHPGRLADLTGPLRLRRLAEVRRQRRRLWWGLISGLVAIAAVWVVAFSPILATRRVDISGFSLLTDDQVRSAAAVPLGMPLIRQDTTAVAERVRTLAPVESVRVRRVWPDALVIEVRERSPVAAFRDGGTWLLVDAGGVAYARGTTRPDGVLAVSGDGTDEDVARAVGRVVSGLPDDVAARVTSVAAPSAAEVTLRLSGGHKVVWGGPDDGDLKAEVLRTLLRDVPDASTYDVSAPAFPATR